jgi:hypothetical protein
MDLNKSKSQLVDRLSLWTVGYQVARNTSVSTMRNYTAIIDRRCFCGSIAGLTGNAALTKPRFPIVQRRKKAAAGQGFLIVNCWVLTRKDVDARVMTPNVV